MGKHKDHKSKKSKKKHKHRKHSDSKQDSSSDEIVWTENTLNDGEKIDSKTETNDNENVDSENEDDDGIVQEEASWMNIIEKSSINKKQSLINKDIKKHEDASAQNKIRYARELNSYYRDDVNKKFIDEPDKVWKTKNDEIETSSEQTENISRNLTNAERNSINAKIIKAEILGNIELVNELKEKLKNAESDIPSSNVEYYAKRPSKTDQKSSEDKISVKELYFQTKNISSRGEAMRFVSSSSKLRTNEDEYEDIKTKKKKVKLDSMQFERIKNEKDVSVCHDCFHQSSKHLLLKFPYKVEQCFITLTPYSPFIPNYCQIRSKTHLSNISLNHDEDCWSELRQVMRTVSTFFDQYYGCTVIFMETCFLHQKRQQNISKRHFIIECVPIKKKLDADVKIYFHKAIIETGEEWAMNKKLIILEGKTPLRKIPKGLPYFWVSIGPNFDGFGHVIEDEDYFRKDFGKEIIGGLRDIQPNMWMRPKHEDYDSQIKRIIGLKNKWNEFIQLDK